MTETYVPFGGSRHVVRADTRLCGCFSASVVFRSHEELESLIAALIALRDGWDDPMAHIHLLDYELGSDADPTRMEVTFSTNTGPNSIFNDELRDGMIARARNDLKQLFEKHGP